jgi:predicted O-methyltransferase YrrM
MSLGGIDGFTAWVLIGVAFVLALFFLHQFRNLKRIHALLAQDIGAIRMEVQLARGAQTTALPVSDLLSERTTVADALFFPVGEFEAAPRLRRSRVRLVDDLTVRGVKPSIEKFDPELDNSYSPTYEYDGPYIDRTHKRLAHTKLTDRGLEGFVDIRGYLHPEDALTLYELAFFTDHDVLELGCNMGLSTSILSQALSKSGMGHRLFTSDLGVLECTQTSDHLKELGLDRNVAIATVDATSLLAALAHDGKTFGVVFVDHSHAPDIVADAAWMLRKVVAPGGFVLFHDYYDIRNYDAEYADYGVLQGVESVFDPDVFEFVRVVGCSGLYRRRPHRQSSSAGG